MAQKLEFEKNLERLKRAIRKNENMSAGPDDRWSVHFECRTSDQFVITRDSFIQIVDTPFILCW